MSSLWWRRYDWQGNTYYSWLKFCIWMYKNRKWPGTADGWQLVKPWHPSPPHLRKWQQRALVVMLHLISTKWPFLKSEWSNGHQERTRKDFTSVWNGWSSVLQGKTVGCMERWAYRLWILIRLWISMCWSYTTGFK